MEDLPARVVVDGRVSCTMVEVEVVRREGVVPLDVAAEDA